MAAKCHNDNYGDIFGDSDEDLLVECNAEQHILTERNKKNDSNISTPSSSQNNHIVKDITNIVTNNANDKNNRFLLKSLISTPKNADMNSWQDSQMRHSTVSEHSVNRTSSISLLSSQERLELSNWGLPETVVRAYSRKGIHTMFTWQAECLQFKSVIENGGNLVYSAPTSAGKTLVSEILMMKRVFECKKKAIIILPFVSLAREKMHGLKDLLKSSHVRVGGFMGQHHPPGGFARVDIAVCTIEKANSLVNRLLEEKDLEKLGVIVVDELHLLGDSSRGYLLELLLTKIRYMSLKNENIDVQIIGMSATLPNLDLLAQWLNAELYTTDYRPVPLTETIKVDNSIFNNKFELIRELNPLVKTENDADQLVYLCLETIMNGHSVLVFCPTKMWCEKLSDAVAKEFWRLGKPPLPKQQEFEDPNYSLVRTELQKQLNGQKLNEVIEQLKKTPAGLDAALSRTIRFGVAYHHAGLTYDERDIIEGAFKDGALRVLIATSTLSAGVNLPARRVIVRCPFTYQTRLIDTLSYKQMIGRAGRKGIDTEGESILFCREAEKTKVEQLISSELEPVSSCLIQDNGETLCSSMKRAILEVIASGVAETPEQVEKYASCTLLSASMTHRSFDQNLTQESKSNTIISCIKFLEENEFIRLQPLDTIQSNKSCQENTKYIPTQLGLGCLASSLSPDEALTVFTELQKARKCFVLENELHIIYQVVPIYAAVGWPNLDFMNYLTIWESLPNDAKRVGELVGIEERFLVRAMRGTINTQIPTQARLMAIHQRFYTALALHDLINEVKLSIVSRKYGANKGMLQSLQQAASTFAGMVTRFCSRLGWLNLELLIGQYQERFQFGIQRELIDLCRLTTLNGQRARLLFNSGGLKTVSEVAHSKPEVIENLLRNAAPFESGKVIQQGESEYDVKQKNELRSFWITGKKGITEAEAAKIIVEEAREILQKDLGVQISDWNQGSIEANSINTGSNERKNTSAGKIDHIKGHFLDPLQKSGQKSNSSSISDNAIRKQKKNKLKEKSPLERAKEKIRLHGERTGTGRIVKEKSKNKHPLKPRNQSKFHSLALVQSISSPNFNNINGTSTPVKKHERSFDTSAQIEEIFDVQRDEMNGNEVLVDENISPDNSPVKRNFNLSTDCFEDIKNKETENTDISRDHKEIDCNQQIRGSTQKRVSWDSTFPDVDKQDITKCDSTPKIAKLESTACDDKKIKETVINENVLNKSQQDVKITDYPQSSDIFGDSFLPDNLSNLSCMNSKKSKLSNSRSCPNTPNFEVCSEKLLISSDVSDLDHLSLVEARMNHDSMTKYNESFSNGPLKHETKMNDDFFCSVIAFSSNMTNDDVESCKGVNYSPVQRKPNQNQEASENIFKTPLQLAPHANANLYSTVNSQDINKKPVQIASTSFTFSDSDTDGHLEATPNIPMLCRKEQTSQCDKSQSLVSRDQFTILDVYNDGNALIALEKSLDKANRLGCSFACLKPSSEPTSDQKIGQRTTRQKTDKRHKRRNTSKEAHDTVIERDDPLYCHALEIKVIGMAVSCGNETVFYLSFMSDKADRKENRIDVMKRLDFAKKVLEPRNINEGDGVFKQQTIIALDMARFCKIAQLVIEAFVPSSYLSKNDKLEKHATNLSNTKFNNRLFDPRIALWLLRHGEDEYSMEHLVYKYSCYANTIVNKKSTYQPLHDLIDNLLGKNDGSKRNKGRNQNSSANCSSKAMFPRNTTKSNDTTNYAIAEAFLCYSVTPKIESDLKLFKLSDIYHHLEMPALSTLVKSDLNGFGFSEYENERMRNILGTKLTQLEKMAYKLANRKFQLSSPSDVCQVLYQELKLPINGEKHNDELKYSINARGRRLGLRGKVAMSTNKDVLTKLKTLHELPGIVIDWRKINSSLSNTVYQFACVSRKHHSLKMQRVYPTSNMLTATGRMTMQDPSIQMVPKDFEVNLTSSVLDPTSAAEKNLDKTTPNMSNASMLMTSFESFLDRNVDDECVNSESCEPLSLRRAFIASEGCLLISADYSQMELRILAHLSKDQKLNTLLQNRDGDIFKAIASSWLSKPLCSITSKERQSAKQICYGILYGMGPKALAEQLDGPDVTEEEAMLFMTTFKSAYPEIQSYIEEVISKCRKQGFVETITGRRRYLPDINLPGHNSCGRYGGNEYARAAAERQAINTTIQGSAADIIKKAMINIDRTLSNNFPSNYGPISRSKKSIDCGAFLVLQLHDELIYEVASKDVIEVAKIIRTEMENAIKLTVPIPVKIKIGPSWGGLSTLKHVL